VEREVVKWRRASSRLARNAPRRVEIEPGGNKPV
jgi:hypothetical protein